MHQVKDAQVLKKGVYSRIDAGRGKNKKAMWLRYGVQEAKTTVANKIDGII